MTHCTLTPEEIRVLADRYASAHTPYEISTYTSASRWFAEYIKYYQEATEVIKQYNQSGEISKG